jgi:hypothetical protein
MTAIAASFRLLMFGGNSVRFHPLSDPLREAFMDDCSSVGLGQNEKVSGY